LGVAVTKRESAGVDVIVGGAINPPCVAGKIEKECVVNGVGILVDEKPEIGGSRDRQVGSLGVNAVTHVHGAIRDGDGWGVKPGVHGHAADAVIAGAAQGINGVAVKGAAIGRTPVNAGAADIRI
jgi:hypothetical protein